MRSVPRKGHVGPTSSAEEKTGKRKLGFRCRVQAKCPNYSLRVTLDGNLTLLESTFALLKVTQLHFTLTPLNLPYFPRGVIQGFGLCWRAKRAPLALGAPLFPKGRQITAKRFRRRALRSQEI